MNEPLPTVHVVDDEDAVRDAVAFLLEMHGLAVRGHASGPAFLAALEAEGLRGCVLLDVRMEPMSGLQLHEELRRRGVALPVIFLSGHGDIPMAVQAVHNGALDFLVKPFDAPTLLAQVRRALALEADAAAQGADLAELRRRFAELTPREHEVAARVAAGQLNKVIAYELDIAMRTVEVHRARVLAKLGVRSSAELATLLERLRQSGSATS